MALLIAPSPVHMPYQPLVAASEELATALDAGDSDHREPSVAISSADMLEAQKFKSSWPSPGLRASLGGKSAKEQ